ncbi:hypothetical protein CEXT_601471 [Caerostris extrusa]|uniref:Uncharacterized protein n=1 Tax=Caerostris extrusa TaxID=172846 RepID=A0AAV4QC04_CAEEX|nr:hypothetical protein CEXT_601471 [Caerostris extrusa]
MSVAARLAGARMRIVCFFPLSSLHLPRRPARSRQTGEPARPSPYHSTRVSEDGHTVAALRFTKTRRIEYQKFDDFGLEL